jgi:hypothetical protein
VPGNLCRIVRAAVIDNNVFPVWISLSKNAFDAFRKMHFFVIEGGYDADQGLRLSFQVHLTYCSQDVPGATRCCPDGSLASVSPILPTTNHLEKVL